MNCAEKLLEPTVFFILYTTPSQNSGFESPWRKKKPNIGTAFTLAVPILANYFFGLFNLTKGAYAFAPLPGSSPEKRINFSINFDNTGA